MLTTKAGEAPTLVTYLRCEAETNQDNCTYHGQTAAGTRIYVFTYRGNRLTVQQETEGKHHYNVKVMTQLCPQLTEDTPPWLVKLHDDFDHAAQGWLQRSLADFNQTTEDAKAPIHLDVAYVSHIPLPG